MRGKDSGEATILLSVMGAIASGAPLAVGVAINNDDLMDSISLITAIIISFATIGAGVGRLYSRWKRQIEASINRDQMIEDLCERIQRIEERQLWIMERVDNSGS
jgi:hypothetical protein